MSLSILLVDDNPIVREVLSVQLRTLGHEIIAAVSTAAAIEAARARRFDAMLIDQRLDGEDGSTLLPMLRGIDGSRDARAIAISAELDDRQTQTLLSLGFDAALEKPIDIDRLRSVLPGNSMEPTPHALDDAAALAIWGNMDTVRTLRGMLRDELPVYRGMLESAGATRDESALRDALHRMKSSAGFCGAVPLTRFIDATPRERPDWKHLLARYDVACTELIPDLQALSAP